MSELKWYSMNAGRINTLSDHTLISLITYIPEIGRKEINGLLRVSKRFNVLTSSDVLWLQLLKQSEHSHWINTVWFGKGKEGSEESEWQRMKDDAGLPLMNMFKIHWMSQNTSRLKIFYGSLSASSASETSSSFLSFLSPSVNSAIKRKIVILGYENGFNHKQSHKLLQQLHYLVPESATRYHLNSQCRPLMKGFVLTEIEPSPITSRSRNMYIDPGTRVETHAVHNLLTCCRLGDERLSFVQFAVNNQRFNGKQEQYSAIVKELFNKAIGNIVVVEYCACAEDEDEVVGHDAQLRTIYSQLKTLYAVVDTRSVPLIASTGGDGGTNRGRGQTLCDMEVDRSYAKMHGIDTPVLVFVAIHLPKAITEANKASCSGRDWQSKYKHDFIQNITSAVCHMMSDIVSTQSGFSQVRQSLNTTRSWYVQPMDADGALNHMRGGVFAGTNWLLRAVQQTGKN